MGKRVSTLHRVELVLAGALTVCVGLAGLGAVRDHRDAAAGTAGSAQRPSTTPMTTTTTTGGPGASPSAPVQAGHPHAGAPAVPAALDVGRAPFRWPSSVWARRVDTAPVATDSDALVGDLMGQVAQAYGGIAAFNVSGYNVSAVTAAPGQARVTVHWDNCQHKPYTPPGLLGPGGQFDRVPIPDTAIPAAGSDAELTVLSPSTDQLWEFWQLHRTGRRWSACWGGRIDHVSRSPGYFANGFGASATGLATVGGMVSVAEGRSGVIDHALALAVTDPAPWDHVSWPAQRSDGSPGSTGLIAEGTRFRLDPHLDVRALGLSPLATAIARAAQRYGFVVSDKASAVSVIAQNGALAQLRTGANPWQAILAGTPSYEVLRHFPWEHLQALPADYGRHLGRTGGAPTDGWRPGQRSVLSVQWSWFGGQRSAVSGQRSADRRSTARRSPLRRSPSRRSPSRRSPVRRSDCRRSDCRRSATRESGRRSATGWSGRRSATGWSGSQVAGRGPDAGNPATAVDPASPRDGRSPVRWRITRAGAPAARTWAGSAPRTTEFAPMTVPAPIEDPAVTTTFAPIQTSSPIEIGEHVYCGALAGRPVGS